MEAFWSLPREALFFNLVTTVSLSDFVAFLGSHRKLTVEPGKKQTPTQKMEMRSLFWWLGLFSKDSGKKLIKGSLEMFPN